jgi:hypothetical protein
MPTIAAFLLSITGSLAARVLTSLGIGFASYAVLSTLTSQVVAQVTSNYQAQNTVVLNLLNLAGGGTALGIIIAALITRASLQAIKRFKIA